MSIEVQPGSEKGLGLTPEVQLKKAVEIALEFFGRGAVENNYRRKQRNVLNTMISTYGARTPVREIDRESLVKIIRVWQARDVEVYHHLRFVKQFFALMVEEGVTAVNPVQYRRLPFTIRPHKVKPIISEEQYRRLLEECVKEGYRPGWPTVIMVGWQTGLRSVDAATLQWDYTEKGTYVDVSNEVIIARPTKKSKQREQLEIPITGELLENLRGLYARRSEEVSNYVTPRLAHDFIFGTGNKFREDFLKMVRTLEMWEYSFHCFRHTFVTRLLRAGVNPIVVASLTGQSLRIIQRYSRVNKDDKLNALDLIRNANHAERLRNLGYQHPQ